MLKRTKIVATLGPSSHSEQALSLLIEAGVDVVRLNFSHGSPESHLECAHRVREIAQRQSRHIAILGDLQGPKIRVARFHKGSVTLEKNQLFMLNADLDSGSGNHDGVGITYKNLVNDCEIGQTLLLDDGRITMEIVKKEADCLQCKVIQGGKLSDNKGINLQGGGLSAPAITEKDRKDIELAAKIGVDYLAVSFVRFGKELDECRNLFTKAGGKGAILAKIERAEVVENQGRLEEVITAADAVMVARGDLGVEIGDAELVAVQKSIISMARHMDRPVITATQMMESMIQNSLPTRAEVFDVANAVLDGTDAVMLSAETATGHCPHAVVSAMHRIVSGTEKQMRSRQISMAIQERNKPTLSACDETIAVTAMYAANHLKDVKAIVCLTKTGQTALWMSRINSALPIFAFSRFESTCRRLALYRGVYPLKWSMDTDTEESERDTLIATELKNKGLQTGDKIILTFGGHYQSTNTMKIMEL